MRIYLQLLFIFAPFFAPAQLLYRATNPAGDTSIYIFATAHVVPPGSFAIDPILDSIIHKSTHVFIEGSNTMEAVNAYSTGEMKMLKAAYNLPNGSTLKSLLNKQQFQQLLHYYHQQMGIPKKTINAQLHRLPVFFDVSLRSTLSKDVSIDDTIYHRVKKGKKFLYNMDTPTGQAAALGEIFGRYDLNWLLEVIESEYEGKTVAPLIAAYLQQDTAGVNEAFGTFNAQYTDVVLDQRNSNWVHTILQHAGAVNFMYGGAAHIIGRNRNVLTLLRERGFVITAIPIRFGTQQGAGVVTAE